MIAVSRLSYWKGIVDYFYANVQDDSFDVTIWEWLKENFDCDSNNYSSKLCFNDEKGFIAFKLTIPKNTEI